MTKKELMTVARTYNIKGRSSMNKAALQAAVERVLEEVAEGAMLAQEQEIEEPTTQVAQQKEDEMTCTCTDHYIPTGSGTLLAVSELLVLHTEGAKELCPVYERELRDKLNDTINWMHSTKGWGKDAIINLLRKYKDEILEANNLRNWDKEEWEKNNPQADILVNCSEAADRRFHQDDEYRDAYQEYQDELEYIATKSMRSVEAKLSWYDKKLHMLNTELKLHDIIQDALDIIPHFNKSAYTVSKKWGDYVKKCFIRIDQLRSDKKLSYTGWFLFNNQLLEKIGRETKEFQYGEIRLLADTISYYENLKEEARQKIASDKPLVVESQLPCEGYVELHDEIEAHECSALVLAQTE